MYRCNIIYNSKPCFGYIVASTDILPHYYWFIFDDLEFITLYGDAIAFKVEDDTLVPTRLYCGDESFIEKIKESVNIYRKEITPHDAIVKKKPDLKTKRLSKRIINKDASIILFIIASLLLIH